ncbi:CoA transferase [Telmatospirillum sp.]|uniref:CaiB/BaiF CoA transferase family protein n=1 Tax=Telmatospirillum sp. TaxID=2079197 RepID=UPI00284F0B4C|nr:CoA transferase [Telmatospirillum sp.]MDR3439337.1 CoA transferase [Telmatospirillum sp.]
MNGLEGIRVIDLSQYVAAPACPRVLGEMGAEVIKIEPLTGDEQRTQGPSFGMAPNEIENRGYDQANANKNWVSINLKTRRGMEFALRLIEEADVVVTSFRDSALKKLGLDYKTLSKKFPHIIFAQMRGYGERGPLKDAKGFDATAYSSRGGIALNCPQKGDAPANMPAAFGDFYAALALCTGILAALVRRLKTGKGDRVSVNLYHVALWGMHVPIISHQDGLEYPKSRKTVPCPTNNSYQSKDGVWFIICFGHYNKYFELVMRTIGLDELIGNKEVDTLEVIGNNGKNSYVIGRMEEAFSKKSFAEWEKLFLKNDIPFQKCFTIDDILGDEEAYANDALRKFHYDLGDRVMPTSPVRLWSQGDPKIWIAKPVGYDTREYLLKYGYSEEDVKQMSEDGSVKIYDGKPLRFDKAVPTSAKIPLSEV